MSKPLGATLPEALLSRLAAGRHRSFDDLAVPVCSVDAEGWPHPALLGYDEIEAPNPRSLRVRLYAGSRTAANLRRDGHLTLLFVDERGAFYVKARARGDDGATGAGEVTTFDLDVTTVLADAVDTSREPDACITSGIRYRRLQADASP